MTDKKTDQNRRDLLKKFTIAGGAVGVAGALPRQWSQPVVNSVLLPVHAETSPEPTVCEFAGCFYQHACGGGDEVSAPGGGSRIDIANNQGGGANNGRELTCVGTQVLCNGEPASGIEVQVNTSFTQGDGAGAPGGSGGSDTAVTDSQGIVQFANTVGSVLDVIANNGNFIDVSFSFVNASDGEASCTMLFRVQNSVGTCNTSARGGCNVT